MMLETADGRIMAALTSVMAETLGLNQRQSLSEQTFRQKLDEAGVVLHGADYVYYFPEEAKNGLLREKS
ncbi:GNAT family N-acetyltransferase, partial [Escherichia coli]